MLFPLPHVLRAELHHKVADDFRLHEWLLDVDRVSVGLLREIGALSGCRTYLRLASDREDDAIEVDAVKDE